MIESREWVGGREIGGMISFSRLMNSGSGFSLIGWSTFIEWVIKHQATLSTVGVWYESKLNEIK